MASGGYHSNKQSKPDSGRRSNWQRSVSSDRDDAQSLNSLPSDIRINNWDLADLHPMNSGDSKRRKKSKGNPEREREQSLSMDSPPCGGERPHGHTSYSYPRTRINPGTPTSDKISLERLKQQILFGEFDMFEGADHGDDQERNNERRSHQARSRLHNASLSQSRSNSDMANQNNNMDNSQRESGPDGGEIVARLVQIRDFMKQARGMLDSMEKMGDRKRPEDVEKVCRLIRNLQEQEQSYKGLLQNTMMPQVERRDDNVRREDSGGGGRPDAKEELDDSSVDLEVQTQNSETSECSQDVAGRPLIEDKLGLGFEEDEDNQGALEAALGMAEVNASCNNTLDQVDGAVGATSIQETEEGARGNAVLDNSGGAGLDHQELVRILHEKQQQLQALMHRQDELNVKRREAEKRLMEAQARDNKARAALAAATSGREMLQQMHFTLPGQTSPRLHEGDGDAPGSDERGGGEDGVLKSNIVGYPESDDEDNSNVREGSTLPSELLELRRELNFLRNEFSQEKESPNNMERDTHSPELGRQQLQNKLQELQNKKSSMDKLLHELQILHSQPSGLARNNEPSVSASNPVQSTSNIPPRPPPPIERGSLPNLPPPNPAIPASLKSRMKEVSASAPNAIESAMATFSELAARGGDDQTAETMDPAALEQVQEKLKRLKDVRGQLDQLRELVEYYQGFKDQASSVKTEEDVFAGDGEMTIVNEAPRQGRGAARQQLQAAESHNQLVPQDAPQHQDQGQPRAETAVAASSSGPQSSLLDLAQLLNLAGNENGDEHSDEDNASVSQSDSQWSHLGPWDDDPEIQEKVRKLKAAKEKLRHLQDLVAFVQQTPDTSSNIPHNLGELVASIEGEAVSQATQTDEPNVSVSEGEVPMEDHRESREEATPSMANAQAELEQLKKERVRLMELQNQLKHFQSVVDRGTSEPEHRESERRENVCNNEKTETEQAPNATVVTFASNDELYSKMRRQRILREELRSKKKELEAIMKKDRNKRQYSRNQDNQSDTVSLNTDAFGIAASVDATMATWGGSTVDNLENITEDEDQANEEDDGYPSDGIVQVEEEEEENDTDNGTYTIEADARQRKNLRKPASSGIGARPKTSRGRQTFPQPAYSDQTSKKSTKKPKRHVQSKQREAKMRQENYRSAEELIQEDEAEGKGHNSEWFRLMESRLDNLSVSVDSLVKKLDSGGRQLSVSLSQENSAPNYPPPMQEQMLQLQNQSMMLSFSHVVQSLARQQGDMQQMQQQMHNLQIQLNDVSHEHSFHLRPSNSMSALNNTSGYQPHSATAPALHHLQSPYSQGNLNNSTTGNLAGPSLYGQLPSSGVHPGVSSMPAGTGSLGSNLSLHQNNPSHSFVPTTRDFGHQRGNTSQYHTTSFSHLDSVTSGQLLQVFPSPSLGQDEDRKVNSFSVDRKGNPDHWPKKYDLYSSPDLQMSTPKLENAEAERRRVPEDKNRRGPIGRENSSDMPHYSPLYGAVGGAGLDALDGGGTKNSVTQLQLNSSYSSIQSIKEEHNRIKQEHSPAKSANTDDESNTLFDSLRDTIYTEVASLISQNENRPHFLLELFREIRNVDSDLMRQRTLYSVQELVNSHLKSQSNSASAVSSKPGWLNVALSAQETLNSDQTPSESVVSEDEEDFQLSRLRQMSDASEPKVRGAGAKFPFEYRKNVRSFSNMSTSSNQEEEPFFQDTLGETVIEFESLKRNANPQGGNIQQRPGESAFLASEKLLREMRNKPKGRPSKLTRRDLETELYGEGASNSGADQASESSMSDMPYPRIDMKQLDLQIKQVMMETIPIVKDHMDDVCSSQLLAYIKRLVLSLTSQAGSQEFARFFHRQLSSILQDTLEKYEGRKMRECGEDLLVEISDVLFNELAFFRLMQDIEDPLEIEKLRGEAAKSYKSRNGEQRDTEKDVDEAANQSEDEKGEDNRPKRNSTTNCQRSFHTSDAEQEELGNDRDDELANEGVMDGDDQDEDDDTEHSYKIELAPSETKPFTRIGSDEDDDNSDEEQSVEDLSETAVSRNDAKMETPRSGTQQAVTSNGPPPVRPETYGAWGEADKDKQDNGHLTSASSPSKLVNGESKAAGAKSPSTTATNQMNGSLNGDVARDNRDDDEDDDDGELTVDDLPERLTVGSCDATATTTTTSSST